MMEQPAYKIILALSIGIILALLVTGCANNVVVADDTRLAANLTQTCPPLNQLNAGDGKTITKWIVGTVDMYEDCRSRHSSLVEAVKPKE